MTNRERLREIDRLFAEILGTLDNSSTPCACCTSIRYANINDHHITERVAAARKKIGGLGQSTNVEWIERT